MGSLAGDDRISIFGSSVIDLPSRLSAFAKATARHLAMVIWLFIKEWGHGALDEPPCPLQ
jgi:hypothetical protein